MSFLPRRKILVPVDFSDCSAPAVRVAMELASAPADVHVVHVIPELNPVSPVAVWGEGDVQQRLRELEPRIKRDISAGARHWVGAGTGRSRLTTGNKGSSKTRNSSL